jgi:hypothetical protein
MLSKWSQLNVEQTLEHTDQYKNNWKQLVQRMDRGRIPRQMDDLSSKRQKISWKTR